MYECLWPAQQKQLLLNSNHNDFFLQIHIEDVLHPANYRRLLANLQPHKNQDNLKRI